MKKIIAALCILILAGAPVFAQVDSTARRTPDIIVSAAGALVINGAVTEALKSSVHEMRPDRSSHNSFPSRHTSWAFAASTAAAIQLYRHSPWWALGAQAVASAIGIDRVIERRHYGSDVIAGAAVGTASAVLADWISSRIFGYRPLWRREPVTNDFRMQLSVYSQGIFSFGGAYRTGVGTGLDFRLPLHNGWGLTINAGTTSTPVKRGDYVQSLNSMGINAGVMQHIALPYRSLALEPAITIGYERMLKSNDFSLRANAMNVNAACGLSWRITKSFGCRGEAGYRYCTEAQHSALTLSVSSVAIF